ncbi:MAG: hypothetical protein H6736_19440 [Alphaproteobacteria bacterium]|nr:hypothetical protein [Alphaproteobacteria bacterium]MCB9693986.1 hypothetical protein [Alphaproteobacteria bacterium]
MDAPAPYKTAAICNLVSGAFNILVGLSLFWLCYPLVSIGIGAWQIMVGMKMNSGEKDANAKNSLIAGAVGGLITFNFLSLLVAGFGFMQMGQDEVVGWLEG